MDEDYKYHDEKYFLEIIENLRHQVDFWKATALVYIREINKANKGISRLRGKVLRLKEKVK